MERHLAVLAFMGASVVHGAAAAQPPEAGPLPYPPPPATVEYDASPRIGDALDAPANAFELTLGVGYTQGFGSLRSGVGLPSVVTPGVGFDVGLGYRINPHWAVLWSGQYQELSAERTSTARGLTTSIAAQYHFAPMKRVDPWVELGGGYRFLWEDPAAGPSLLTWGFQLGRVRAGLDFRNYGMVAFGPMIGADATMFTFQDAPNVPTTIDEPRLSTFVFAGVQGRFDVGGRVPPPSQVVSRR